MANTYHCVCGKTIKKSTSAESTGNRLDNYGPGHECYGCPYVLPVYDGYGAGRKIKAWECRTSRSPVKYATEALVMDPTNTNTAQIVTLDLEWIQEFIQAYLELPGSEVSYLQQVGREFSPEEKERAYRSVALNYGRRIYGFSFTSNRKGKEAKKILQQRFFPDRKVAAGGDEETVRRKVLERIRDAVPKKTASCKGQCPYLGEIVKSYSPVGWVIQCSLRRPYEQMVYSTKKDAQSMMKSCRDNAQFERCLFFRQETTRREEEKKPMEYVSPSEKTCPYYKGTQPQKGGGHRIVCEPYNVEKGPVLCHDDGEFVCWMQKCGSREGCENCGQYLSAWLDEHGFSVPEEAGDDELKNIYDGAKLKASMAKDTAIDFKTLDRVIDRAKEQQAAPPSPKPDTMVQSRTIADVTAEIRFYKAQTAQGIIEIGKRLLEAKSMLDHGQWLPWLREQAQFSVKAAQRYMQLATEYSNATPVSYLPYSKLLALLAVPAEEREEFIEVPHEVSGEQKTVAEMSRRELEQVIRERDQARAAAAKNEQVALERLAENDKIRRIADDARADLHKANQRNQYLQQQIDHLERQPVDVAVAEPTREQLQEIEDRAEASAMARIKAQLLPEKDWLLRAAAEKAEETFADAVSGAVAAMWAALVILPPDQARRKLDECVQELEDQVQELRLRQNRLGMMERTMDPDHGDVDF